jgi:predicted transcriptional regulator
MIEQLFGSKTRVKLLQLFYGNTNRSFYVREITRKIDEQINSVRRELANLLSIGIITSNTSNNKLYYEVDQKYQYYDPLNAIFGTEKQSSKSIVGKIKKPENPIHAIGNIELAIYTGIFTRDETSGIDILIVGNTNPTQLAKFIADLETQESKEIRYTVMPVDEFNYRKQVNDRFVNLVISSKKQVIVDKNNILSEHS